MSLQGGRWHPRLEGAIHRARRRAAHLQVARQPQCQPQPVRWAALHTMLGLLQMPTVCLPIPMQQCPCQPRLCKRPQCMQVQPHCRACRPCAGDGVEGEAAAGQVSLSVAEQQRAVDASVIRRFPFLAGCTALQLPPDLAADPARVGPFSWLQACMSCRCTTCCAWEVSWTRHVWHRR